MSNLTDQQIKDAPSPTTKDKVLETGASMVQDFAPISSICAHLNAFHVYASDPSRCVEANHYCSHITKDIRQCLIYASPPTPTSPLIGIEYMITPSLYATLPPSERALWHSHVYEVQSGLLIMPQPSTSVLPKAAWEAAERKEMEEVVGLYGKTYHFWQTDRGDSVPMGGPELMGSFTKEEQMVGHKEAVEKRDEAFRVSTEEKRRGREGIKAPEEGVHEGEFW
ncbi:MAG: hypothetical protein Q9220_003520 [cf. Caloplaca sp. 1 TL-2023]